MTATALTRSIAHWRAISAGLCATLVGVGLARFAYTPLIPALIAAHWYAPSSTVYLGAANLAGYWLARCWRGKWRQEREPARLCAR